MEMLVEKTVVVLEMLDIRLKNAGLVLAMVKWRVGEKGRTRCC